MSKEEQIVNSIQYAAQLGRLDFVSALLGCIAIILALGGIFAFINIRSSAKKTAKETAKETAEEIAEKAACSYIENNLPSIVDAYLDCIDNHAKNNAKNYINATKANQIAQAQEGG